jgi:hypothetical protein
MKPAHKNKLLRRKKDALHHTDIFVRDPRVLSEVREALEQGPQALSLPSDDQGRKAAIQPQVLPRRPRPLPR